MNNERIRPNTFIIITGVIPTAPELDRICSLQDQRQRSIGVNAVAIIVIDRQVLNGQRPAGRVIVSVVRAAGHLIGGQRFVVSIHIIGRVLRQLHAAHGHGGFRTRRDGAGHRGAAHGAGSGLLPLRRSGGKGDNGVLAEVVLATRTRSRQRDRVRRRLSVISSIDGNIPRRGRRRDRDNALIYTDASGRIHNTPNRGIRQVFTARTILACITACGSQFYSGASLSRNFRLRSTLNGDAGQRFRNGCHGIRLQFGIGVVRIARHRPNRVKVKALKCALLAHLRVGALNCARLSLITSGIGLCSVFGKAIVYIVIICIPTCISRVTLSPNGSSRRGT